MTTPLGDLIAECIATSRRCGAETVRVAHGLPGAWDVDAIHAEHVAALTRMWHRLAELVSVEEYGQAVEPMPEAVRLTAMLEGDVR